MSCRRMNPFLTFRQTFSENERAHLSLLICDEAICYILLHKILRCLLKIRWFVVFAIRGNFPRKKKTINSVPRLFMFARLGHSPQNEFSPLSLTVDEWSMKNGKIDGLTDE